VPAALVVIVGIGRMYVGAHTPLDLVGGAALGVCAGCVANLLIGVSASDPRTPGSELISRSAPRGNEKPSQDAHWSQIAVSLAVIALVSFPLPKLADYSKVWAEIQETTWLEFVTIAAVALPLRYLRSRPPQIKMQWL